MQNPFSTTYSKIPSNSYIPTGQISDIIENFRYDDPSESVYKITGVRGSGKTVLLAKIEQQLQEEGASEWIILRLSPARDILQQLAAHLAGEDFIQKKKKNRGFNVSASVLGTGGGIGISPESQPAIYDIGTEIDRMLRIASSQKRKILIGIDEVSKNTEMIVFASEFGKWLRAGYPVYLVCTGLYENIEQLSNVKNLTFFRRAATVKTQPLNLVRMAEMYKDRLGMDAATAKEYAGITKGYPYAFQMIGSLCFKSRPDFTKEPVLNELKADLYAYAYEKIWEELSTCEKELVVLLSQKPEMKRTELLSSMKNPGSYSVYRDRLLRKGIAVARQGCLSLSLPFFGEYIQEYWAENLYA